MPQKIAAHIGDLEKGLASAWDRDRKMSEARNRFDWQTMFAVCIDPEKAKKMRLRSEDRDRDVCTMCGDMCALKTHARAFQKTSKKIDGFAKSPNSLLRCIPRCFSVRRVRIIARDLRASNLELFSLPSKFDFLKLHQN